MQLIGILDDSVEVRQSEMTRAIDSLRIAAITVHHDNARDFIDWLADAWTGIRLVSLDHDLGPTREREGQRFDPGTGMDVADFLVSKPPAFPVIVNSSNPMDSPIMVQRLESAGWKVRRVIPFMDEWIPTIWLQAVENALDLHS